MKRVVQFCCCILLLWTGTALGAATMTVSGDTLVMGPDGKTASRVVDLACTAHTDGVLSIALTATYTGLVHGPLVGWRLFAVETKPGTTAPTDGADLTIADATIGEDILDGNGENKVDNSTVEHCYPELDGSAVPVAYPIHGSLTIGITGAGSGGQTTLRLILIP